ncbi:MAG: hypothetical protein M1839_006229 [Geoglossum umbratile]|nr:MAG: hypothetical protein M1839_006229 [Geoglossum umbratile]
MSMSSGPSTFTEAQLRTVWRGGLKACPTFPRSDDIRRQCESIYCNDFRWGEAGSHIDDKDRKELLASFCMSLQSRTADPATHFSAIDDKFSELFLCQYQVSKLDPAISEDLAVQRALLLLTRLPSVPPRIDLHYYVWGNGSELDRLKEYYASDLVRSEEDQVRISPWAELRVVSTVSTTTLRLALLVASSGDDRYNVGSAMRRFADLVSELLDTNSERTVSADRYDIIGTSIIKAFLWTVWQRSLMLFLWFILRSQLRFGYSKEWNEMLALRGSAEIMNPSIRATLFGWDNRRHSYMCAWAFELLRSSRTSMGLDFRRFHERFAALHMGQSARCQWDSDEPCDGGHPFSCGRFQDKRLVAAEQSLHDLSCGGNCERLQWDEASYRSIDGPTAASLDQKAGKVHYTKASSLTMAISHVWSHGQGSRPHDGINSCLHRRYAKIAKKNGCTSYWIDSICIPESHDLRMEAIGFINRIFGESKITLVCDRDLMEVDIANPTLELLESILVTFYVCDWNVRAWTLLEGMKGNHAIHLLCKFNRTIPLLYILTRIHQAGCVDISVLSLMEQHLLPSSTDASRRRASRQSAEAAGTLLSHRHATREGDEIVIWSLLSGPRAFNAAEQMWKAKINQRIATAYLMSNSPRLEGVRAFSWAPKTPYVRRLGMNPSSDPLGPYNSFDGADSEFGLITPKGLIADWQVYDVERDDAELYQNAPVTVTSVSTDGKRTEEILPGHRIKNTCWQMAIELYSEYEHVALIQPGAFLRPGPYRAAKHRGESHGEVFAICASRDMQTWVWKGVRSWPHSMPLPPLSTEELLIA